MLSVNLAWWQPDNSIHLIYPLDSTDLPQQSIMLTISFPPARGGGGGGPPVDQQSPAQLDQACAAPKSNLATCSDISKRLLRLSDISICPPGKREGLRVTAFRDCPCKFVGHSCACTLFCFSPWFGDLENLLQRAARGWGRLARGSWWIYIWPWKQISVIHHRDVFRLTLTSRAPPHAAYKSQHAAVSFGCLQQPSMTTDQRLKQVFRIFVFNHLWCHRCKQALAF